MERFCAACFPVGEYKTIPRDWKKKKNFILKLWSTEKHLLKKKKKYIHTHIYIWAILSHKIFVSFGFLMNKQSLAFLLYATPPFIAVAHFLPTLLHTCIRLTHIPGADVTLELQDHKTHLILRRQQEMATALFLLCPYTSLLDPMLLICYCPTCTGLFFNQ